MIALVTVQNTARTGGKNAEDGKNESAMQCNRTASMPIDRTSSSISIIEESPTRLELVDFHVITSCFSANLVSCSSSRACVGYIRTSQATVARETSYAHSRDFSLPSDLEHERANTKIMRKIVARAELRGLKSYARCVV